MQVAHFEMPEERQEEVGIFFYGQNINTSAPDLPHNELHTDTHQDSDESHEQAVALVAAGLNDGYGTLGTCSENCKIYSGSMIYKLLPINDMCQYLSRFSSKCIVDTLNENDIRLVSISYYFPNLIQAHLDQYKYASDHDINYVISTGNMHSKDFVHNGGITSDTHSTPDNVLYVTAMNPSTAELSSFSNIHSTRSIFMQIAAPGEALWSSFKMNNRLEDYKYVSGTSFATPFVAGAIAEASLLCPNMKISNVLSLVVETGDYIFADFPHVPMINITALNRAVVERCPGHHWQSDNLLYIPVIGSY